MDHITTPKVDNVRLLDRLNAGAGSSAASSTSSARFMSAARDGDSVGTLYLTTTHLIYVDSQRSKPETWILLMHIESVEKLPLTTQGCPMIIKCKTFLSLTFIIPRERECHEMVVSLTKLSKPRVFSELYAFSYNSNDPLLVKQHGWDFFDLRSEYERMGVPNEFWKLSDINYNYELTPTYPRHLFVPTSAAGSILAGSAGFRSKGRLPVLTYLHSDAASAICRSSQPLSGFQKRSVEDETLLQIILRANPDSKFMYVVDTRPKINAMANRASGKGYESEDNYRDIKFKFSGVENIHVMRSSLQKLLEQLESLQPTMSGYLSGVDSTGWLKHIQAILKTSAFIARAVAVERVSVLVHCSDGWDRTAQTCSLAQVMLDPHYRTIRGIEALIEKDWLSFGHKFNDRCGHLLGSVESKEVSPVFTQFLDCLFQMQTQFPQAFEFNEKFLLLLHDHVYSCQFGTFLGNCERQRREEALTIRTYSFWGYIHSHRHTDSLYNPFYKESEESNKSASSLLFPDTSSQAMQLWVGMYNRFDSGLHPCDRVESIVGAVKDHVTSMQDHARHLSSRISQLRGALLKSRRRRSERNGVGFAAGVDGGGVDIGGMALVDGAGGGEEEEEAVSTGDWGPHKKPIAVEEKKEEVEKDFEIVDPIGRSNSDADQSGVDFALPFTSNDLANEIDSVVVDWRLFRHASTCPACGIASLDPNSGQSSTPRHCWSCGEIFCSRCMGAPTPLPGHASRHPAPVCKPCQRDFSCEV